MEKLGRVPWVAEDLGDRKCERCGNKAQWGAGPNDEHVLCLGCAGDWSEFCDEHPIAKRMGNWERNFAEFLQTKPS